MAITGNGAGRKVAQKIRYKKARRPGQKKEIDREASAILIEMKRQAEKGLR